MDPRDRERPQGGEAGGDREIGPSGGPPDDRERQRRGATPTEDVMEEPQREGAPAPSPRGTGARGELGEPDPGVPDPGDLE